MDAAQFDNLTRTAFQHHSNRRRLLTAIAGCLMSGVFSTSQTAEGHRRRRRRKQRGRNNPTVPDPRQQLGGLCGAASDCQPDADCVPGRNGLQHCKPLSSPDSCLGVSERCGRDADCCGTLSCLASDGFASCQQRSTEPGKPCQTNPDCGGGAACVESECACLSGLEKCDNRCVDPRRDASFCGNCATRCNEGETCRDGRCRCGENAKCAKGEICFDSLCFQGGGGSGDLPLYGWGGGICSFATDSGYCVFISGRVPELYGAVRRFRDGRTCKIEAQNKGECPVCVAFGTQFVDCRPQVTPTDWQIRRHCSQIEEFPETKIVKVDCVLSDCAENERAIRNAESNLYECKRVE